MWVLNFLGALIITNRDILSPVEFVQCFGAMGYPTNMKEFCGSEQPFEDIAA
jgi:hypothetical protein